ncbi:unnamed protein product [Polarella glacialis]|uniref:Nudix hydrolase domain-containing protein n=1 Tax=Polarella glacialis TaxID=89957 RepID=A0A813HC42_POLGL|nr:unnamed protein product [Polarella glacialis]CAE8635119.1 unnamed protein product [Polarella glacialis]CAE8645285.1 unnamed protein product [Polarella glacialis]
MTKAKKSKYVGSCGIYVFVAAEASGQPCLLVHRRSRQVSEPLSLCAPGGIVERPLCGADGNDFEAGAKATALRELLEETGIALDAEAAASLDELPVGEGTYWGPALHKNFCIVLQRPSVDEFPAVPGPERASLHELVKGGMDQIGHPAGDQYHAWVPVQELLARTDLMLGCRRPLEHFAAS